MVECFHSLPGQHPCIFKFLFANSAKYRVFGWVVLISSPCMKHSAWPVFFCVLRIFLPGIIQLFRLFLSIKMIKVAEPFIKAMHRREKLISVAEMVFAE